MIAVLVGKQCCQLSAVEREIQASLEVDLGQEVITVWALRANLDKAVQHLQGMVDEYKHVPSYAVLGSIKLRCAMEWCAVLPCFDQYPHCF